MPGESDQLKIGVLEKLKTFFKVGNWAIPHLPGDKIQEVQDESHSWK